MVVHKNPTSSLSLPFYIFKLLHSFQFISWQKSIPLNFLLHLWTPLIPSLLKLFGGMRWENKILGRRVRVKWMEWSSGRAGAHTVTQSQSQSQGTIRTTCTFSPHFTTPFFIIFIIITKIIVIPLTNLLRKNLSQNSHSHSSFPFLSLAQLTKKKSLESEDSVVPIQSLHSVQLNSQLASLPGFSSSSLGTKRNTQFGENMTWPHKHSHELEFTWNLLDNTIKCTNGSLLLLHSMQNLVNFFNSHKNSFFQHRFLQLSVPQEYNMKGTTQIEDPFFNISSLFVVTVLNKYWAFTSISDIHSLSILFGKTFPFSSHLYNQSNPFLGTTISSPISMIFFAVLFLIFCYCHTTHLLYSLTRSSSFLRRHRYRLQTPDYPIVFLIIRNGFLLWWNVFILSCSIFFYSRSALPLPFPDHEIGNWILYSIIWLLLLSSLPPISFSRLTNFLCSLFTPEQFAYYEGLL